ncbi:MAG TPA: PilW family protein [Arenicellales bacterium]|nr:PilW family protein [Arenicellales bacterium]
MPARQYGMSLIELMIAMTISLVVIGAVSGVYLSTSRSYTQDEMLSRMQENARYALHVLSKDLSMAGYWGPLITNDDINTVPRTCSDSDASDPAKPQCHGFYAGTALSVDQDAAGNVCAPGTVGLASNWVLFLQSPLEVATQVSSGDAAAALYGCISASEFESGTDILAVKRVEARDFSSTRDEEDDEGELYLRTNGRDAMLVAYDRGDDASEGAGIADWPYRPSVFYVRNYFLDTDDGIPTLVRKTLNGDVMETEEGGIAQGIEYFHVMFGVDLDDDGDTTADFYTASPAIDQLDNIVSARIYVLARSVSPDPGYDNTKTYSLGDVTRTVDDNYYRRVFTTTVSLRNPRNRMSTSGS